MPEVYEYLKGFLNQDLSQDMDSHYLARKAAAGGLVIVRYLQEIGADSSPQKTDMLRSPLHRAVDKWHEDVIDVLHGRGADPNERSPSRGIVLTCAAKVGSMSLLRKILDAGAKLQKQDAQTLWH